MKNDYYYLMSDYFGDFLGEKVVPQVEKYYSIN